MDLDFLQELIDTPDYVPVIKNQPRPPVNPNLGTVSVLRLFPGVMFHCNDRTDDVRCKTPTRYLWRGDPCCLKHALPRLQELIDSDAERID